MARYLRTALGAIAAAGVVLVAATAIASPAGMQGGMGAGMGMNHHGMHGQMSGPEHGGGKGMGGGHQLMTPAEREALHERMRAAKTPEERQALAAATHVEMEKRAKEKGIALPEHRGSKGGMGQGPATGPGSHQH